MRWSIKKVEDTRARDCVTRMSGQRCGRMTLPADGCPTAIDGGRVARSHSRPSSQSRVRVQCKSTVSVPTLTDPLFFQPLAKAIKCFIRPTPHRAESEVGAARPEAEWGDQSPLRQFALDEQR